MQYSDNVKKERKSVIVDRAIKRIHSKHGRVTAELLLAEAKKDKDLYKQFEWDDKVAGHKWRMDQAYQMLMASKLVVILNESSESSLPNVVGASFQVRSMVNGIRNEGFKMRNEAMADEETRKGLVEKKLSTLRSWCRETIDFDELQELRLAILSKIGDVD